MDSTTLNEIHWKHLLASLRAGTCVLVLGWDTPALPGEGDGAGKPDGKSMRDLLGEYLAKQIEEQGQRVEEMEFFSLAQQYADTPAFATMSLATLAMDFLLSQTRNPGPIDLGLAKLPFRMAITTCYDDLLERALSAVGKRPVRAWYDHLGAPKDNHELEGQPTPDAPVVYHLFGVPQEPTSLVLTADHLLDFIIHLISGRPKLPDTVRNALRNKTFLIIGFPLAHWYMRVFLKLLMRALDLSEPSLALESTNWTDVKAREQAVIFYRQGSRVHVVHADAEAFVGELQARFEKAPGPIAPAPSHIRRATAFISYTREDDALARRIYDELPKDHFDCWLDRALLEPGEDWNLEIEEKIKSSDYFMILNSEDLARKDYGYVYKEIAIALDQQKYRPAGMKFVIPLAVGGLDPSKSRRELQAIQHFPLRPESFSEDVRDVGRLLWRDYQVRQHTR